MEGGNDNNGDPSLRSEVKKEGISFMASAKEAWLNIKATILGQIKKAKAKNEQEASEADLQTAKMQINAADPAVSKKENKGDRSFMEGGNDNNGDPSLRSEVKKEGISFMASAKEAWLNIKATILGQIKKAKAKNEQEASEVDLRMYQDADKRNASKL
ncbi:hypothetical protein J5N97_015561 [Dioscorea zingiberensis]|uniref:Uncharacterized protein n=1 Tax=Dioscorea zingiberensis TaxID=325984 RepID=A0A9D5CHS7_9LILI|nr:hypothetical protein J5N97_015561 [Dioscorea zingiberensis]